MSSLRLANHRRSRSTSDSISSPSPHHNADAADDDDNAWQTATKRTRPHHPSGPGYARFSSSQKWDVDVWRRGKRARRDTFHSSDDADIQIFNNDISSSIDCHGSRPAAACSEPSTPAFASTSAEFHLFSKQDRRSSRSSSRFNPISPRADGIDNSNKDDLTRLRSYAFWELRRSIEDSGEGLVNRMREYEESRSKSGIYSRSKGFRRRGQQRPSQRSHDRRKDTKHGSDEDDVQIFAGDRSNEQFSWSSRKARALSFSAMDVDSRRPQSNQFPPSAMLNGSQGCSSPGATCQSNPSNFPSDDEDDFKSIRQPAFDSTMHSSLPSASPPSVAEFTPVLSNTRTNSSSSSLVSLPLLPPRVNDTILPSLSNSHSWLDQSLSSSASRSEKAIAALTLAMANGAGALNDYEALRAIQSPPALSESEVGELWH